MSYHQHSRTGERISVGGVTIASSSSVYGNARHGLVREEDATDQPISLYGATKKVLKWSRIPIIISTTSWSVCVLLSMSVNDQIWPASFHTTHFERPADWCVWSCMARFYLHWWYCRWNLCGGKNLHGKSRILPRKLNTPRSLSRVETACGKQAIKTISYATGRCQTDIRGQCMCKNTLTGHRRRHSKKDE